MRYVGQVYQGGAGYYVDGRSFARRDAALAWLARVSAQNPTLRYRVVDETARLVVAYTDDGRVVPFSTPTEST